MSETPNILKEKNSTLSSRFISSINSSNSKIKGIQIKIRLRFFTNQYLKGVIWQVTTM